MHNRRRSVLWIFVILLVGSAFSCTPADTNSNNALEISGTYFSLESYFKNEATRLAQSSPEIKKTVSTSGSREEKKVTITDWNKELDLFISADINKPAWKGQYSVDSTDRNLVYTAVDPELLVQYISIGKGDEGEIKRIEIKTSVKNILYTAEGNLVYCPDSLYEIRKHQHVRIVGQRDHHITGVFKK